MRFLNASLIDLNSPPPSESTRQLQAILEAENVKTHLIDIEEPSSSAEALRDALAAASPDVIFLVITKAAGEAESELIGKISALSSRVPVIAVLGEIDPSDMLGLFKLGITDFISSPFKAVDVLSRVWRLTEHIRKEEALVERLKKTIGLKQLVGKSPLFTVELEKIPLVARCDSSVLISGETGTGKEMFARAIHYLGPRSGKPFIPVNCGAIPADLIENELFGHAKGAFTGAITSENGLIQETNGGTLFLDEIDCLPLPVQVKLLRFLQEKEYRQLGSAKIKHSDARIIAATNIDLGLAMNEGRFRKDLFYRLNILPLSLPPLRERREDISLLVNHFVSQLAAEFKKELDGIEPDALRTLLLYDWPGNVRELQNVIERAVVFSSRLMLRKEDLDLPQSKPLPAPESFQQAKTRLVVEFEKNYIHSLLAAHRGNITQAARTAGKNRRAFWELMKKHDIDVDQFRLSD